MIESFLFIVLANLQGLDIWTTKTILDSGGKELNPVMKFFMDKLGVLKALFLIKGLFLGLVAYGIIMNAVSPILLGVLCVVYAVVVAHNWKHLPK